MKPSYLLILLCTFLFSKTAHSQRIDTTLAAYAASYQPERLHIQFDKPAYTPGDTLWFKVYIASGVEASTLSKNCYTDFYNIEGKLLAHSVFPVVQSGAAGAFRIPDSLAGSAIYIKAYTAWMLNFDTAFLFQKKIPLVQNTTPKAPANITIIPSLRFFPEGGEAAEEIPVRIAFKATGANGTPVAISGLITNNTGAFVDTLTTAHDGMGSFHITYKKGETYTAHWKDEQNNTYQTPLPVAAGTGATLEIIPSVNKKTFIIRRSEGAPDSLQQLHIVATQHQHLVYMAGINLTQTTTISGGIPTDKLPTGILQITLFSSHWQPLAERICFVNNNDAVITPIIQFTQTSLQKRAKNIFNIQLPDSLTGNLSIAITDKGIGADSNSIVSQLLLSGELKGNIYKPWYYFANKSDSVAKHLDLLMLTNGWRRYHWLEITAGRMPVITHPAEENYFIFSGKIIGASKKQLASPGKMYAVLQAKDSSRQITSVDIQPDGSFADSNTILFDSTTIISQFSNKAFAFLKDIQFTNNLLPAQPRIALDSTFIQSPDTAGNNRLQLFTSEATRLKELTNGNTLRGVTVTTRPLSAVQALDKRYTRRPMFQSGNSYQFDLTHLQATNLYRNVFDYLNNKVGTVVVQDAPEGKVILWKGSKATIYLDEDPVPPEVLYSLPVENIAYVKAYPTPFLGNYGGGGSAIVIYSRKGVDRPLQPGIYDKTVRGYTLTKEFYSPSYDSTSSSNNADLRSTLYWNPMILTTPEDKKLSFTFYNNDITHAFRLILEGITPEGKLIHVEKVIE